MDITTLSSAILGFIISQIKSTKGFKKASDEISNRVWEWIRPLFVKDDTSLKELHENPDDELNHRDVKIKIEKYLKNNPSEVNKIKEILLREGVIEKGNQVNIIDTNIKSKGRITIIGGNQNN